MATYLDVGALIGIKMVSSGTLAGNSSFTVPANSFAIASVYTQGGNQQDTTAALIKIVPAGVVIATTSTTATFGGKGHTLSAPVVGFVVFSNNQ